MCKKFQSWLEILLKCGIVMFFLTDFSNAQSLKDIKTFSADFTQTLHSSEEDTQNQIVYKGKVVELSPSRLRWGYVMPITKEILI